MLSPISDISSFFPWDYADPFLNLSEESKKEPKSLGQDHPPDEPVRLNLSPEAEKMLNQTEKDDKTRQGREGETGDRDVERGKNSGKQQRLPAVKGKELSESEKRMVAELQKKDREVRAHEEAHAAAAGPYAVGGPNYVYQTGPDGKSYAIGGNVKIDLSPESSPEATIAKAETIIRAALAPVDPSGDDRAVAAAAAKMEMDARQQLAQEIDLEQAEKRSALAKNRLISQGSKIKYGRYGLADALSPSGKILDRFA